MDALSSHREALKWAADLLEMTMADVTEEQLYWAPPGTANPIGATYAHAVCSLDALGRMILQGKAPLYDTEWAGRTGISDPQWGSQFDWARALQVDLPAARIYAQAVYVSTDSAVGALATADLAREVDMTNQGLGVHTLNWCINALMTSHINNMAGEISVLKGLQGAKGYPF